VVNPYRDLSRNDREVDHGEEGEEDKVEDEEDQASEKSRAGAQEEARSREEVGREEGQAEGTQSCTKGGGCSKASCSKASCSKASCSKASCSKEGGSTEACSGPRAEARSGTRVEPALLQLPALAIAGHSPHAERRWLGRRELVVRAALRTKGPHPGMRAFRVRAFASPYGASLTSSVASFTTSRGEA